MASPTLHPLRKSCGCQVGLEARGTTARALSWGDSEHCLVPPGRLMEGQLPAQPARTTQVFRGALHASAREGDGRVGSAQFCPHHCRSLPWGGWKALSPPSGWRGSPAAAA